MDDPAKRKPAAEGSDPGDGTEEEPNPWLVAGVFGALGFEFVGFIVGGWVVGSAIDNYFGTEPYGTLGCILLGLVGVLWHIFRVSKRFLD